MKFTSLNTNIKLGNMDSYEVNCGFNRVLYVPLPATVKIFQIKA